MSSLPIALRMSATMGWGFSGKAGSASPAASSVSRRAWRPLLELRGMCALASTSMADIPGNVDDHYAALALEQQQRGHQFAIMIMQKVMVPTALHQLQQDHGHGPLRMVSLQI